MGWINCEEYFFSKLNRLVTPTTPGPRRSMIFRGLLRKASPQHLAVRPIRMRERPDVRRLPCPAWEKQSRQFRRKAATLRLRLHRRALIKQD